MTAQQEDLPRAPEPRGELIDARLRLLDRQVHDREGVPVMVVDDLELSGLPDKGAIAPGAPAPTVAALLAGPLLAVRVFGGKAPMSRLRRIAWEEVRGVGTALTLAAAAEDLDADWAERWVRDRIIRHIPGARHDPH
ncbi:hypothetical protein [Sinomonas atrocyanea]